VRKLTPIAATRLPAAEKAGATKTAKPTKK